MLWLKTIIERQDTIAGKVFDVAIQILIVLSLVTFSIDTMPDLTEQQRNFLNQAEVFCVIIFSAEYVLRVLVADRPLKFIFSFFGLIDLLAILPFYLVVGLDLRSLRAFRLFRLFRLFKLMRYNNAIDRFRRAFILAKEELLLFTIMTLILLFLSAVGIYFFENEAQPEVFSSVFDSLWWAVATLTTVGYGDIYPITAGGKIFTFLVLLIGLGIVAVPAGLISSAFSKVRNESNNIDLD